MKGSYKNAPWIVIGLISVVCFLVFKNYLLLKHAFLFWDINDDSFVISYPKFTNICNYIATYGVPKWSFKVGMGQNIFPFLFDDPFDIIIYLAGAKHVAALFIYVEVVKIILSGIVFFYYLKQLKLSAYTCILGSLLFSFCSFIIVGGPFYIFPFQAFNLALYLLAFELLFNKQKWVLFPLAIFLTCISQPFNLYLYGIFMVSYTCLRYFTSGHSGITKLASLFGKMLGLAIIGILISGPFLLENINQVLHSARGSGLTSYASQLKATPMFKLTDRLELGTSIMRFFSNDLIGSSDGFKGWFNYIEAPMFYCGLPCLLLFPQLFFFLEKKARIIFAVFIALWMAPLFFPYFRYAFWVFAGNYYRLYAFFISAILMYYALLSVDYIFKKRQVNTPVLAATLIAYLVLLCCPIFFHSGIVHTKVRIFVIGLLMFYSVVLALVPRVGKLENLKLLFFIAVLFELGYSAHITVKGRADYTMSALHSRAKIPFHDFSYTDWSLDAIKYIQQQDNTFYRIDRSCDSSDILNAAQIQGYNGTTCYCSFNQLYYIRYLLSMGVLDKSDEAASRWIQGLSDIPILETENGVKYFLQSSNDKRHLSLIWDSLTTIGDVRIYKNNALLPFGFTYDRYITASDLAAATPIQKQVVSTHAFAIDDKDVSKVRIMKQYRLSDTSLSMRDTEAFKKSISELRADTLTVTKLDDNYLSGTITTAQDKMVYLSIPYDEGWHLQVDGKSQDKIVINGGMTGVMIGRGTHTITMAYVLPFGRSGVVMFFAGVIIFISTFIYLKRRNKVAVNSLQ